MAKKQPEPTTTAIEKPAPAGTLERPSFLPDHDKRGTEHLTKDDLQLPRLSLAQQMSPQLIPGDPAQIQGLTLGDMFNNLTGEIYGKGPMEIIVVRADKPRGIEFYGEGSGLKGVKDFNVPLNDARMQFGPNGEKPVATKFYDYVVVLLDETGEFMMDRMVALSLKGSGLKVARQLNALMKLRNAASFSTRYRIETAVERNTKGTFAVLKIRTAGWVTESQYAAAQELYESIKDRALDIEREPGSDDGDEI